MPVTLVFDDAACLAPVLVDKAPAQAAPCIEKHKIDVTVSDFGDQFVGAFLACKIGLHCVNRDVMRPERLGRLFYCRLVGGDERS